MPLDNDKTKIVNKVSFESSDMLRSHELEQLDVVWRFPPLLPIFGVVGGDRRVSNRSIKLDEKNVLVP